MLRSPLSQTAQWRLFAAVWVAVAVLAVLGAGWLASRDAQGAVDRQAATAAALHGAVLRSELERVRAVPSVLAADPDLEALVTAPSPARRDVANAKLESLAREVRAAALYVLDADGTALAASNWREPTSFVGSNYRFRPYFSDAVRDGEAAFFALGTVSGRPGLYLSRRIVDASGRLAGVIVAKIEFDALETMWRRSEEPTWVTDATGVILITTVPDWRFRATLPLSPERRRTLAEEQTAGASLSDLPFTAPDRGLIRLDRDVVPGRYAHAVDAIPDLGWTLHLLQPADQVMSRAVGAALVLAALATALLAALSGVLLRRRQRAAIRAVEEEEARARLEHLVGERTAELSAANGRLRREIDERRRLERDRQDLEDKLVQANKLATLGQVVAGVAHEINQPMAAIRTHADTAGQYLTRADPEAAARSLTAIGRLTERVGAITEELRAFSRKTRSEVVAVDVGRAVEGALLLVSARLREQGVEVDVDVAPDLQVKAERNRLEQVVLNLLQNAAEALDGPGRVEVTARPEGRKVVLRVADDGPGLSPEVRDRLFTPFTTDKPQGVGLGLVISRDIVAGFGGELSHEPTGRGAAFRIVLARAK
ncbi:MAG: sensor histidine kinase [Alphaproteobacteria bacterium]|nr:sensor histidine kinase [Alphaproteobacteria bacterium]MBU1525229.1 sensor histidine kinase [Alphaproteobacteria bacterium]MBU2116448.1 sensor histidine kinase [Alphaproteobacteria bacterium]MBU2352225.1 sensor histidine kinase [Alphaproteobacteria bacterium]MBU2383825.1 sensor histidine kinase [Alphaproteobacteria bacterium]